MMHETVLDQLFTHARAVRELAPLPGSNHPSELLAMRRDPRAFLHTRFAAHGSAFKSNLVVPCVFVVGESWNRTVLSTQRAAFSFGQGYARTAVRHVFEGSIMLQDGSEHANTREALSPALSRLSVRESADRVVDLWAARLSSAAREAEVDAYELASRGTFDVAAHVLMGVPLGADTDSLREDFELLIDGMMALIPARVPWGRLTRALSARERLVSRLLPVVRAARTGRADGLPAHLHAMQQGGAPLSDEEIARHLLLLAWAGYDTTASAATWLLTTLAERHDLQERLREELLSLATEDTTSLETGRGLPTVECFLLELERMYPSALLFPRITTTRVEHAGHVLPKGVLVLYTPYLSHRDPHSFERPNTFDPDRFAASRGSARNSASQLFGFGGGPRVCIGKAFAKLQLKVLLHSLLTRYQVEPAPTARPQVLAFPVHRPAGARIRIVDLLSRTRVQRAD
jgi:cytochrome P450